MPASEIDLTFWSENLQESIQAASQQARTLLCFVSDGSEASQTWDAIIRDRNLHTSLIASTIRLHLRKDSQEFGFLNAICSIQTTPALVLINQGHIEEKLESASVQPDQLREKLSARYASVGSSTEELVEDTKPAKENTDVSAECLQFAPSSGLMRLPNNAYDSLRERTEKLQKTKISPKNILALQLRLMDNVPALKPYVQELRSRQGKSIPAMPEEIVNRLLNTSASMLSTSNPSSAYTAPDSTSPSTPDTTLTPSSSSPSSPPPESSSSTSTTNPVTSAQPRSQTQQSQRADYLRAQREREASQRAERERIKEQIKADREERRRLDTIRKQSELATLRQQNSTTSAPTSTDIRIQVRTFDGSTLRTSFPCTATVTNNVRPWIDQTNQDANRSPYNLKVILTPLPNRTVETSEEDKALPELGIVGSATLVMVPVTGFVDSYAGASTGVAGSVIGGVVNVGTSVFSGVLGILGWGSSSTGPQQTPAARSTTTESSAGSSSSANPVKVRTLADQRTEESKKRGNQLYNGNSLDFQGRKNDDDRKED